MKKLISALLVMVMCVSMLVGCGKNNDTNPTPTPTTAPSQSGNQGDNQGTNQGDKQGSNEAKPTETPDAPPVEEYTGWRYDSVEKLDNPNVTFAVYSEPDDVMKAAIAAFEAKYGGKVNVIVTGWNKAVNAIQEGMTTGDLVDLVFTEGFMRFPKDIVAELYQPVDDYLDYRICDQGSVDVFKYSDKHYVFTNYAITQPSLLFYNVSIFEEEGLETPTELFNKGEWTYAKFLEYMAYFTRDTDADGEIDQWGLGPRFNKHNFGIANDATQVYPIGNGEIASGIDTENMIQYYEFLNTFGTIDTKCPGDGGWLENRSCVFYNEVNTSMAISADYSGTDEFDFVPFPTYDGRLATTPAWDNGYALATGAPNPVGAAVLATMICKYKMDSYDTQLAATYNEVQVERYRTIAEKMTCSRRNYEYEGGKVNVGAGEGEAMAGEPAQTIIETYKAQLEGQVAAYNESLKK